MATLTANKLNLLDLAKRQDSSGVLAQIVEMLTQVNDLLLDIPWVEANNGTGHVTTVRTGLPTPTWKLVNGGTTPSKSRTAQITEACAMLEAWSETSEDLVKLSTDAAALLMSESKPHIDAMGIEFASTFFYGTAAAPEEIVGIGARFNSTSAANGDQILLAGGAQSDNSSVYLIGWGEDTVHGIYAKGFSAGLKMQAFPVETTEVAGGVSGSLDRVYRTKYSMNCGIAVRDWRYISRLANIDISTLVANSSPADLLQKMAQMTHRIYNLSACRPVFYMNRTTFQMLDVQVTDAVAAGGGLTFENVDGQRKASFRGIPIHVCDALVENESVIS
jgi:hypothetical protein